MTTRNKDSEDSRFVFIRSFPRYPIIKSVPKVSKPAINLYHIQLSKQIALPGLEVIKRFSGPKF